MAATQRLTAYGVTPKGSGYADADDACEEASSGTQLLATDNSAVYVYAEAGEADERIYLVKIATPVNPTHFYVQGDGYAADQKVYVPEQAIGGIFGTLTTAGWYTVAIDDDFATAVYITTFDDADEMTQPTACPEEEDAGNVIHQNDPGNTNQTGVVHMAEYEADGTASRGITIKKQIFKDANFDSQNIDQLPFSFGTSGPAILRGRSSAFRITTKKETE